MAEYFASKVLQVAQNEVGYQEKSSNSQLDGKHTETDGSGNYTKYHRDMGHGFTDPWCQTFVDWCFVKAYGMEGAKYLCCGYLGASTMEQKSAFEAKGQLVQVPMPGDIWWRKRDGGGHVGIVYAVQVNGERNFTISTYEGNTGPSNTGGSSDWNGDGVYSKTHSVVDGVTDGKYNTWFGRPAYTGLGNIRSSGQSAATYLGGGVLDPTTSGMNTSGVTSSDGLEPWAGYNTYYNELVEAGESEVYGGSDYNIFDLIEDAAHFISGVGRIARAAAATISALGDRFRGDFVSATYEIVYETVTAEIEKDEIKTVDEENVELGGTSLLTYPSLVEAPYIILTVGNYKFGSYSKREINNSIHVSYPNYIDSMTVVKINGQVNQYTINMVYQIEYGQDPNLVDRIFSTVGYGLVKISYGDWNSPTFIYKEEEAIITNLTSSVDFANSRIRYTLKCTSNALVLASGYFDFEKVTAKPSDKIKELLKDESYGLSQVFTGMYKTSGSSSDNMNYFEQEFTYTPSNSSFDETKVNSLNLIASDDKAVEIEAKHGIDVISYINYLVSCMSSVSNSSDDPIKDSTYMMSIHDDTYGTEGLNGSYFKVTKIDANSKTLATSDVYEVDVGFPTDTLVMNFTVNTDNSWALLYNYSDKVNTSEYMYSIDNNGNLVTEYSPAIATSSKNFKMTESQKTWWTNMTQFPIKAELTIKGLVRPALLMTYIRINALFFGQRHVSSGLYIITKQTDQINASGYRTTLGLLRIGGDTDYVVKTKTQVTSNLPVSIVRKDVEHDEDDFDLEGALTKIRNAATVGERVETGLQVSNQLYEAGGAEGTIFYNYPAGRNGGTDYLDSGLVNEDIYGLGRFNGNAQSGRTNISSYSGSTGKTVITTEELKIYLWEKLKNCFAGNDVGTAAAMGNLIYESDNKLLAISAENLSWFSRNGFGSYTNETFTDAVDTGQISKEVFHNYGALNGTSQHRGYGIAQWTWDRKNSLYDFAKKKGTSVGNFFMQVDFLLTELKNSYYSTVAAMTNAVSIEDATDIFCRKFESPNENDRINSMPDRIRHAKACYEKYKMNRW